jgi:hypothetical protein
MSTTRYPYQVSIKLEFSQKNFRKNAHTLNFMKIRRITAELLHADGWTDVTKLIIAFRNFVNAPTTGTPGEKNIDNICEVLLALPSARRPGQTSKSPIPRENNVSSQM